MNSTDMINILGNRVEDIAATVFTDAAKLTALNNAQTYVVNKLRKEYLTELQVIQTSLTATSGVYAMSSLTYSVLRGAQGILKVKIASGNECTRIKSTEQKKLENTLTAGSIENPIYWVFKNTIYVSNGQTNPSIDVYYQKVPADLFYKVDIVAYGTPSKSDFIGSTTNLPQVAWLSVADDTYNGAAIYSVAQKSYHIITDYDATGDAGGEQFFMVEPDSGANWGTDEIYFLTNRYDGLSIAPSTSDASMHVETSELNVSLHEIIITYAEAELWAMDAKIDRKDAALAAADLIIQTLNDRYVKAEGVGTSGGN